GDRAPSREEPGPEGAEVAAAGNREDIDDGWIGRRTFAGALVHARDHAPDRVLEDLGAPGSVASGELLELGVGLLRTAGGGAGAEQRDRRQQGTRGER